MANLGVGTFNVYLMCFLTRGRAITADQSGCARPNFHLGVLFNLVQPNQIKPIPSSRVHEYEDYNPQLKMRSSPNRICHVICY
ncbi:hypothetical protein Leryth_022383 [Lithospermum erythrorhizon]|nr:hypothetical protein Leryth_022383 [Lithospermum erythrorhizon]